MSTIHYVAVIGGGAMGRQIALNAALAGHAVSLHDSFADALEQAKTWTDDYLAKAVAKGKMTKETAGAALERLTFAPDLENAVRNVDLVIEAIIEKEDVKAELFRRLGSIVRPDTILATNSSYMPSSKFAGVVNNPGRLLNLHYFNPAMRMDLVEIVRGRHTDEAVVEKVKAFADAIGKSYVLVNREIDGFVVNRLLRAVQDEAYFLLENGIASVEDIDKGAEKGLNYPMGPFRLMDLTGLDINYYNRSKKYEQSHDPHDAVPLSLAEKFTRGEYGRKTGKGWYTYE